MTADVPDSCGREKEHHLIPSSCDNNTHCCWPDCLNDSGQKNMRALFYGQLDSWLGRQQQR